MGLIVDTGVFISIERRKADDELRRLVASPDLGISAITVSELLVGSLRANNQARVDRRVQVLDSILVALPVYAFTTDTARIHAPLNADLQARGQIIGEHDLIIAATALEHGHAVLTTNRREFDRVVGLQVIDFPRAAPAP